MMPGNGPPPLRIVEKSLAPIRIQHNLDKTLVPVLVVSFEVGCRCLSLRINHLILDIQSMWICPEDSVFISAVARFHGPKEAHDIRLVVIAG
jgi:hypothetical protein